MEVDVIEDYEEPDWYNEAVVPHSPLSWDEIDSQEQLEHNIYSRINDMENYVWGYINRFGRSSYISDNLESNIPHWRHRLMDSNSQQELNITSHNIMNEFQAYIENFISSRRQRVPTPPVI